MDCEKVITYFLVDFFSYVGCEDCGVQLPGAARMRPCNIIFLDQVEKAHASVCLVDHTFENRKRQSAMKQVKLL